MVCVQIYYFTVFKQKKVDFGAIFYKTFLTFAIGRFKKNNHLTYFNVENLEYVKIVYIFASSNKTRSLKFEIRVSFLKLHQPFKTLNRW